MFIIRIISIILSFIKTANKIQKKIVEILKDKKMNHK